MQDIEKKKMNKKTKLINWQKPMSRVVFALIPLTLASVYLFGWRALAVLALVNGVGFLCEYIFSKVYNKPVTSAVFVTNFLFALSLPPRIPFWIAAVGIAFGVIFGKMVFGGFGKNIFNPAISGRAFIYVSFGVELTSQWYLPFNGIFGGLTQWQPPVDAFTGATPLTVFKEGLGSVPILNLFFGNTSGSLGETSALLIILGGIYLIYTKTANWRIILSGLLGFGITSTILWVSGIQGVPNTLAALFSGSILYGIMFMATDPVSASQTTNLGRWIYGGFIGIMTILIRQFSIWPAGITFAILLANMFAPLLDHLIKLSKGKKRTS
jgi:Na+-transporting NADH:ubiquinone oxidoreductase subunit B